MNDVLALAEENQGKAWRVVEASGLTAAWESIGAEVHLVGSLKTGLLMKHRDIDFHIYTAKLEPEKSFAAMAKIAANPAVERVTYGNLAATDEHCFEWHAWFRDADGELWQLDMIQIERGTFYDGYFERVAERISAVLTPELKLAILTVKNDTPETEKVMGIEYCQAVIRDGVRTWPEFAEWRKLHPAGGIVDWMP